MTREERQPLRYKAVGKREIDFLHQRFELKLNWDILPGDAPGFFRNYLCWPDFLLDKRSHYLLMVINRKKLKSTRDAAKELGVHAITLHRYILAKKVPAPEIQMVGGVKVRLWSQKDIDRVRELLPKIANGRTKKGKKKFAK